jgi:hypothetical protein
MPTVTSPSTSASPSSPPRALLLAVALVAASILLFEISLTRVFGTVLRYHLTFLAISIALCGLGVGGYAMHWLRSRRAVSLPRLAVAYALATFAATVALLRGVFPTAPEAYWLSALVVLVPFSLGGAWLAEAFARFPRHAGRVYAWDLVGAAAAALAAVPTLERTSPQIAIAWAATLGLVAAGILGWNDLKLRLTLFALFVLFNGSTRTSLYEIPNLPPKPDADALTLAERGVTQPLFTELGTPGNRSRIVQTRHNAFARTDVVDDPVSPGGFLLYTNGNVPTNMMKWDGHVSSIPSIADDFPLSDWCFSAASLEKNDSRVFSIGPGGGLDALLALRYRARRFDGAEINPSIIDIMRAYTRYNGGIYDRVNVNVRAADGRAAAREALAQNTRYDLIFSALTKTATAGQGMALLESFIYTSDAFRTYWKLLSPGGQATIVLDNPLLLARFTATWLQVLGEEGISSQEAMRHIAIVHDQRPGPYVFALVVQKMPFTNAQTEALARGVNERSLTGVWIPRQAALSVFGPYSQIADGTLSPEQFHRFFQRGEQPLDISPRGDDQPFVLDLSFGTPPGLRQLAIFAALLSVAFAATGLLLARSAAPAVAERVEVAAPEAGSHGAGEARDEELSARASTSMGASTSAPALRGVDVLWVLYFLALGVGFMMVEIPLAQQLILPLGYPTLALSVILFAVLLGGGLGSWFSQRFENASLSRYAALCALGVAAYGVASTWAIARLGETLPLMSLGARAAITIALLLPLGFLLGAPFPSGMRLFSQRRESAVPLVWALNGVASVVGSLCAAMSGKLVGFSQTLGYGALFYVAAALLVWWMGQPRAPTSA